MNKPQFFRKRRRLWRGLAFVAFILFAVAAAWLIDHRRARHDHFTTRHGTLVSADAVIESGDTRLADAAITNESVLARSDTGLEVAFRVLRPTETLERLPLVVLLGGHRTGRNAVQLVGDPGAVAVAALDYPYHGPEKLRGLRQGIREFPRIQQALLDTPPAVSLALDWLIAQPWVDPQRIELVGVSLGTPFAAVAGALDTRFRRVWLIHGGADNEAWLDATLERKISNPTMRGAMASMIHLLAHGASFDTADWVSRISPRPVVIVGAREDECLTRANIEALHAAAGEPRDLIWTDGGHVKPKRPEVVRQLLQVVLTRL